MGLRYMAKHVLSLHSNFMLMTKVISVVYQVTFLVTIFALFTNDVWQNVSVGALCVNLFESKDIPLKTLLERFEIRLELIDYSNTLSCSTYSGGISKLVAGSSGGFSVLHLYVSYQISNIDTLFVLFFCV